MQKLLPFLLCSLALAWLVGCGSENVKEEQEKEAYLKRIAEEKFGKQWDFVSRSTFEELARRGERVSVEGLAVNAKPLSYLYMKYHVYIISDREFFWPPRMIGQRMRVTGVPIVKKERKTRYAQIEDYRKRYFFKIENWNPVLEKEESKEEYMHSD